jgi:hypothetical protein
MVENRPGGERTRYGNRKTRIAFVRDRPFVAFARTVTQPHAAGN